MWRERCLFQKTIPLFIGWGWWAPTCLSVVRGGFGEGSSWVGAHHCPLSQQGPDCHLAAFPGLPKDFLRQLTGPVFWHDPSASPYHNGCKLQEFLSFSCRNVLQQGGVKPAQRAASSDLHLIWHLCGYEIQPELWKWNVICSVISHFSPRLLFTQRSRWLSWRAQGHMCYPSYTSQMAGRPG